MPSTAIDLADYFDLAVLAPTATLQDVTAACRLAIQHDFPAVCVYSSAVRHTRELLQSKKTQVCAVIGFPSGAVTSTVKLLEAQEAADNGATELDVVLNLGQVKSGHWESVFNEIAQIREETGQVIKTILELGVLTPAEKKTAAEVCLDAGAHYLKTSTGWFGGATVPDVRLLSEMAQGRAGVKASGGIRTYEQAIALIEAGATRLGTSRGAELLAQQVAYHERGMQP